MNTQWMPKGFSTITPNIIVDNAEQAISYLKDAFGAVENYRLTMANGSITHCELLIGNSILNLGSAMDGWPAKALTAQIFVENADEIFERAVACGAQVIMPMADMFFGSREGRVIDPCGNSWTIATLKEVVMPEEVQRRMIAAGY
jgi:PhnB protein